MYSKPGAVLQSWIEALRGLRDNPLADYWERHDRALQRRRPWYSRHLGLLIFSFLLAAGLSYIYQRMLGRLNADPRGSIIAHHHAVLMLQLAGALLLLACFLLMWGWFVGRYYSCAAACFALLEPQPRGRLRRNLDDLLAVSSLSEAELLCGILRLCSDRLLLPFTLLVLASGLLVVLLHNNFIYNPWAAGLQTNDAADFGTLALALLLVSVGGLIGGACGLLLFICLGAGPRASVLPQLGPISQIFFQLVAAVAYGWLVVTADLELQDLARTDYGEEMRRTFMSLLAVGWLLLPLSLYLARRLQWLRFLLGFSVMLPLLLITIAGRTLEVFAGDVDFVSWLSASAAACLQYAVTPFCPAPLLGWLMDRAALSITVTALLLPLQFVMLLLLAGFARDAIQRRKWGAG